ncbi:multifunctional tRNA nucleotidyl transferase/2'3'-cyclic phosphodiesterase/2'nucleotidase/phosphatase [Actinobacillus equuli]|nr:multifunctional tRNA nucleotidyl transferase/2'3'-cyclic phosphodiesterase/2'nucleotidase/phosphatase [Actinobacillus equuli]
MVGNPKAFATDNPQIYFEVLREIGALAVLFPELDRLFGVPQPEKHHPEIDCGIHTLLVIAQAKQFAKKRKIRPLYSGLRFAMI